MVIIVNIDKKEVKAMITIYGILYGENAKIGNILADKGSSLSFLSQIIIQKQLSVLFLYVK